MASASEINQKVTAVVRELRDAVEAADEGDEFTEFWESAMRQLTGVLTDLHDLYRQRS